MSRFHYKALDPSGKKTKGVIDADNERQASEKLLDQHLTPLEIKSADEERTTLFHIPLHKTDLNPSDCSLFTRQLATLLSAGQPLATALESMALQFPKAHCRVVIQGIYQHVLSGLSLGESLQKFPKSFNALYCSTVAAGEHSGKLDFILEQLADYLDRQQAMKQKIQQALIYPSMMTLVSICVVSFLLMYVVPNMIQIFSDNNQTLPLATKILISISNTLADFGLIALVILSTCAGIFYRVIQRPAPKFIFHQYLLKTPLLGHLIKSINCSRFCRTLGLLNASGLPVLKAMQVSNALIQNEPIKSAIEKATQRVREGTAIHSALQETQYFSPISIQLISSGERSGKLSEMLMKSANQQDNEVSRLLETLLSLFEPAIIIIMGAVVLFIVLSIMMPIFDLSSGAAGI